MSNQLFNEEDLRTTKVFHIAAEVVAGSAAWLGRGLSCVCAQGRDGDSRPSIDLTPAQVTVSSVSLVTV